MRHVQKGLTLTVLPLAAWFGLSLLARAQDVLPGDEETNVQVQTRGTVHEAYAQPIVESTSAGLIVPRKPPEPIQEIPPDSKPQGDNAIWISGYWGWDDERKDFIWTSGAWRVPPPGYSWVPGYWDPKNNGFEWVPGFWSPEHTETVEYIASSPPETKEEGPSTPSPGENYFWVPGNWVWQTDRYGWRPGYWSAVQPDWMWVPACYYRTPRGWVYSTGYWDYPLWSRGLIFAPVYYPRPIYLRPGYFYSPGITIDVGLLSLHLFARPLYSHYYFGDYYAPNYVSWGFYPWFDYHRHYHHLYDPMFVYSRWYYRDHPRWEQNLVGWHRYYREHENMRPPHTLAAEQQLRLHAGTRTDIHNVMLATPLRELQRKPDALVKLEPVTRQERAQLQTVTRETQKLKMERSQLEARARPIAGAAAIGVHPMPGTAAGAKSIPGAAATGPRPITGPVAGGKPAAAGVDAVRLHKVPGLGSAASSPIVGGSTAGSRTTGVPGKITTRPDLLPPGTATRGTPPAYKPGSPPPTFKPGTPQGGYQPGLRTLPPGPPKPAQGKPAFDDRGSPRGRDAGPSRGSSDREPGRR